jgi:predicted O-methyltransferase YrrM
MKIQPIIVTCPERAGIFEQTLARLQSTDWKVAPFVQMDTGASSDRRTRQTNNVWRALVWFMEMSNADFALLLEDDLDFNRFLHWNLERWSPLVDTRLHFGSLYNPNIRRLSESDDHFAADPNASYGSQAYLLSREAVSLSLRDWDKVAGLQDIKLTRIVAGAGHTLYYHKPSLVQHVGTESCWGGGFHHAPDFSADWRAEFSCERIPGWFTFPQLYSQAVKEARDGDLLVEIGAWLGRSTAYLGQCAKASGKRIKLVVVDTFTGSSTEPSMVSSAQDHGGSVRPEFERNMRLADVLEIMEIKEARSLEAAAVVPEGSCALVFIDADHRYEAVRADIRAWIGKVRPGGILAGHDCYTYAEVFNAVRDELQGQFTTTDENVWIHRIAEAAAS